MSVEIRTAGRSRTMDVLTASGIAVLIAFMLTMVMHHPVARQTDASALMNSISRQAFAIRMVHGTLAAALTVMTSLMLGFAMRLDISRPHVLLGAVSSMLGLVLICLAVLLDGFVAPALAVRCLAVGGDCAGQTQALLRFGGLQIEFMTRFGLFATASATALWAGDLILRKSGARVAGIFGMVSAVVQFGILISADRLNPGNLTVIVAAHAVWYVSVGAIILFRQGPYAMERQT